jgi:hypothetical protein
VKSKGVGNEKTTARTAKISLLGETDRFDHEIVPKLFYP